MEKQILNINGDDIAVYVGTGTGTPVVFVHGNSSSASAFSKQFKGTLNDSYKLIAIDLPGHGESAKASNPATYSLPGYAKVVAEVAKSLDVTNAVFVGWSLGGHIVLESADLLPEARGFVILGTPPVPNMEAMGEAFKENPTNAILFAPELTDEQCQQFADGSFRAGESAPPEFVANVKNTDGQARANLGGSLMAGTFKDEVAVVEALSTPIAVLHGAEEQLISLEYIQKLTMPTLWRGEVQVIEGAGHVPQWDTPEKFDALLNAFVKDVTA